MGIAAETQLECITIGLEMDDLLVLVSLCTVSFWQAFFVKL